MRPNVQTIVVSGLLVLPVAHPGGLRIERSPHRFVLVSPKKQRMELGIVALDSLLDVRMNGRRLAGSMPAESVLSLRPDGRAVFSYSDRFLRSFRGREQLLNAKDGSGSPIEEFRHFPAARARAPKFLLDVWKVDATRLFMNSREDILWWTGELTYRFNFAFPVLSLKLESPNGRRTMVGDWEWRKVGRAVKVFASADGKLWTLIWQSHGKGGRTPVDAQLPPEMKGAKTVFVKFRGQNANVLFDLFVTAELDARTALPLLSLRHGANRLEFHDAPGSSHRALVFWKGRGVKLARSAPAFTYPRNDTAVAVRDQEIDIRFPEGVGVRLETQEGRVEGIRRITVGQREVLASVLGGARQPSIIVGGKIEPVRDWAAYLAQRERDCGKSGRFPKHGGLKTEKAPVAGAFAGWHKEGDWVCISVKSERGEAEWLFAPAKARIGDGTYKGVRWKLRLRGIGRAYEVTVEEPVAFSAGDWRLAQVWGPFEEFRLDFFCDLRMPERGYFARQQPFFFLAGESGAVLSFFDHVVHAVVSERREADRIVVRSRIPVRGDNVIETPEKVWLFREGDFSSKWDALNEWTAVFDALDERYRAEKGIAPVEPKPTLLWQSGWNSESWGRDYYSAARSGLPQKKRWFYRLAGEIPKLARWGVRVIYVNGALESDADYTKADRLPGSICFGSVCAPWRLAVSPCMGGTTGLKHLCDTAHRYGVKTVLWSTPAHLSNSSPLLSEHPGWLAWRADGQPEHFGYKDISGISLRRGYFEYAMRQYERIHTATGFDGVWQDSFLTFGILTDFSASRPYPQLDETIEMQRRLQAMGCTEINIEGCGPYGLSSGGCGFGRPLFFSRITGKEYGFYCYMADTSVEPESFFRTLASKGVIGIKSISAFEQLPATARKRIVTFNHAYLQALPFMQRRRLLGKGEKWIGVEWFDRRGRRTVLFAFEPLERKVPADGSVWDVVDGRQVATDNGSLTAEPWHVYLWK
ncbi:MAG: hypothetical protein GXP31_00865 [Kiritimatiellaeota bacterium]|nr:hypothetical protein [Kiritimatiellota bacterium]